MPESQAVGLVCGREEGYDVWSQAQLADNLFFGDLSDVIPRFLLAWILCFGALNNSCREKRPFVALYTLQMSFHVGFLIYR